MRTIVSETQRLELIPRAFAFSGLPVGTPPNAIVFGAGLVHMPQMIKAAFWLNLSGIVLITALTCFLIGPLPGSSAGRYVFGGSRSSRRRTFPIGVFGRASRNSTCRGSL